jgi:hypothetical protein
VGTEDGDKCDDDSGIGGDTKKLSQDEQGLTVGEKEELVLDVLNDDVVSQCESRISSMTWRFATISRM